MSNIGPGPDDHFVIASFAAQIARTEVGLQPAVVEVGNLSAQRNFLDMTDVARAYAAMVERTDALPDGTIYNISSGQPRSIESALEGLGRLTRVPFAIRVCPERKRPSDILSRPGMRVACAR